MTAKDEAINLWNENTQEPMPINKNRMILAIESALEARDKQIEELKRKVEELNFRHEAEIGVNYTKHQELKALRSISERMAESIRWNILRCKACKGTSRITFNAVCRICESERDLLSEWEKMS